MHDTFDVAIVGGGIIGCSSAYALSAAGASVVVLEKDRVAAHASGGAAGILSTLDDVPGTPAATLNLASLALHSSYAERLRDETRIDVEYQQVGSLTLLTQQQVEQVRSDSRLIGGQELRELEPAVDPSWAGALFQRRDGQVNAGLLTRALAEGAARYGAEIREGSPVREILVEGDRVTGVQTPDGPIAANHVVLAAGPWTPFLAPRGWTIPVDAVKGEILWVTTRPRLLNRPIFAGHYLVPKPVVGIAIGATYRRDRFDETPALGPLAELAATALQAIPALRDAQFSHVWAGIRPFAADGRPILGPVPGLDGLILATGHGAYGITLSLITGELVRDWVLEKPLPFPAGAFNIGRFAAR